MLINELKEPKVGDNYYWRNENIRISICKIDEDGDHDEINYVWFFQNGKQQGVQKDQFPYLILSMSEDYEFMNSHENE